MKRTLLTLVALEIAVAALVASAAALTPPLAAPRDERGLATARMLSETIGSRVAGSPGAHRAAAYLEAELRAIPGVEVVVQEAAGHAEIWGQVLYSGPRNVLARLPGEVPGAILVSAHYDAPPEGVGAGDNALGVAATLEAVRALAGGHRHHTLMFNFNGAEEMGLLGADAFVEHPWAHDVVAFVNIDSTGNGGREILFRATPSAAPLLDLWGRAVRHPTGSVIGDSLMTMGLIPSDTDFRVYAGMGEIPGIDLAFYEGGHVYHTARDTLDRVDPRSVQTLADDLVALLDAAAREPLPPAAPSPQVYYDLLGRTFLSYSGTTATVLGVLAGGVGLVGSIRALRGRLLVGLGAPFVAALLAVALPVAASGLAEPLFWYSKPWIGVAAFGALALGALVPLARAGDAAWLGGLAWTSLLLVAASVADITGAYPLLWWVGLSLPGLLARRGVLLLVPAALLTADTWTRLFALMVPMIGRMGHEFPGDALFAGLVGIATVSLLGAFLPLVPLRWGVATLAALAQGAILLLAGSRFVAPYSADTPKRLVAVHRGEHLDIRATDPRPFVDPDGHGSPIPGGTRLFVDAPSAAAPRIEVLDAAPGQLSLRLHAPGEPLWLRVRLTGDVESWSAPAGPPWSLRWLVAGNEAFDLDVVRTSGLLVAAESWFSEPSAPLRRWMSLLPEPTTVDATIVTRVEARL